ncbi:MAG: hypothetical protein RQ866_09105, partial [Bacteroidales bacterium]|nr:hypothetical protein [Bacteroidales bacterium]
WEFANAVTPAFIGGSAIALYILRREGLTMGKSTAVVVVLDINLQPDGGCMECKVFSGQCANHRI